LKSFLLTVLLLTFTSISDAQDRVEDHWVVDSITDDTIYVSVNGRVTHGDRLHIRLVKGKCDVGNLLTFVYTTTAHPDISQLSNQYVKAIFMGDEVTGLILFTSPFLLGYSATIDFNWLPIDALKHILGRDNPITLKFIDSENFEVSEYFDILENAWSNVGLAEALRKATALCKKL